MRHFLVDQFEYLLLLLLTVFKGKDIQVPNN